MGRDRTYREDETPRKPARRGISGRRATRWGAAAAIAAATLALAACNPADGLGSSAVSTTTDQLATHALKSDHIDVQWLSCSATSSKNEAKVDCQGRTGDQQKITVNGRVTKQLDGTCVRGHLTAVVGKRTVFDVQGLGDCKRTASTSPATGNS